MRIIIIHYFSCCDNRSISEQSICALLSLPTCLCPLHGYCGVTRHCMVVTVCATFRIVTIFDRCM